MKIALISPRGIKITNEKFKKLWRDSLTTAPDRFFFTGIGLGPLVIAALTPKDFNIEIIDEEVEYLDFNKKYDLIGISATTQCISRAYEIADEYRKRGIKVILGGIHPTLIPQEAKEHADNVIIGEGERLWPEFIRDFLRGQTKPFYYTSLLADLSKSPMPRYDLIKLERYRIIWVQSTRGCPYNCEFCAASKIYGNKYRHKTIKQVINEIEYIKKLKEAPYIGFADDNMFVNIKYSSELIRELQNLKIRWIGQSDISIAEKKTEFLSSLKKSGCVALYIGFETITKEGLKNLDRQQWKMKYVDNYSEYIKRIQSFGIGVMGAFIVGLDTDDNTIFDKISDFIIENNLYGSGITILTPLPGTHLRKRLEEENRILSNNWDDYYFWKANFAPKNMTVEELEDGLRKIYQRIYVKEIQLKRVKYFKAIYKSLYINKNV